jgi:hypothetical protein
MYMYRDRDTERQRQRLRKNLWKRHWRKVQEANRRRGSWTPWRPSCRADHRGDRWRRRSNPAGHFRQRLIPERTPPMPPLWKWKKKTTKEGRCRHRKIQTPSFFSQLRPLQGVHELAKSAAIGLNAIL